MFGNPNNAQFSQNRTYEKHVVQKMFTRATFILLNIETLVVDRSLSGT